jgi:hypothetical protein
MGAPGQAKTGAAAGRRFRSLGCWTASALSAQAQTPRKAPGHQVGAQPEAMKGRGAGGKHRCSSFSKTSLRRNFRIRRGAGRPTVAGHAAPPPSGLPRADPLLHRRWGWWSWQSAIGPARRPPRARVAQRDDPNVGTRRSPPTRLIVPLRRTVSNHWTSINCWTWPAWRTAPMPDLSLY